MRDGERRWLVALGLAFGLGVALRWYLVIPFIVAGLMVVWARREDEGIALSTVSLLLALPVAIYLATYLPWFGRGYGIAEWWALQVDAVRIQGTAFALPDFEPLRGAWRWVFGHPKVGYVVARSGGMVTAHVTQSNPVVWWCFTPAVLFGLYQGWRMRNRSLLLLGATFASYFLFCVLSPRPVYLYAALPLVPVGAILLAYLLSRLPARGARVALALLLTSAVYLYPLTAPLPVVPAAYGWLKGSVYQW